MHVYVQRRVPWPCACVPCRARAERAAEWRKYGPYGRQSSEIDEDARHRAGDAIVRRSSNNAAPIHARPCPPQAPRAALLTRRLPPFPAQDSSRWLDDRDAVVDPEVRRFTSALAREAGGVTDDAIRPGFSCLGWPSGLCGWNGVEERCREGSVGRGRAWKGQFPTPALGVRLTHILLPSAAGDVRLYERWRVSFERFYDAFR